MKADGALANLSTLALENRRRGLAVNLPRAELTLRGTLLQRYVTCGKPDCKCARGERHGPSWYLTVTLAPGRTTGAVVPEEQLEQVRQWVGNYQRMKQDLESISAINRELLRRKRSRSQKSSKER
jgi:hypothetical protein